MKLRAFLLIFPFVLPFFIQAQQIKEGDSVSKQAGFVQDDPVVSMLDSLSTLKVFNSPSFNPKAINGKQEIPLTDINYFSDSIYRERITSMSLQSPFEFVYNEDVRKFIDLYAYRKRGLTERILGLTQVYFPMFEEQLDKYKMPLELKYLAVIESALNPIANSRAGAKGLWQFMYGTGKVYGLKISSYVDDRFDPLKSTIAACEHMTDLYNMYGSWSLVLAAYNSGAGNVNKAIRRAGGAKNFWVIQRYLPKETRSYVPAFIAASYVLTYASEHHIHPVDPGILFYEVDTVHVRNPLSFDQISEMFNISRDEVQFLNPAYKQGIIPATPENHYVLRLRKKNIADFVNNEMALYTYKTRKGIERDSLLSIAAINSRPTLEYHVKKGETVATVAKKFHMTITELKSLNSLHKNYLKPKQMLLVYSGPAKSHVTEKPVVTHSEKSEEVVKNEPTPAKVKGITPSSSKTAKKSGTSKYIWHTIQPGDNLWDIAQQYDGATVAQIKKLNNISKTQRLQPGQKIKVMLAN
ncbi:MAG: transglycosylase SLT domain-containing protein [Bacteroidota bacterium]